jgi:hypothetical protein
MGFVSLLSKIVVGAGAGVAVVVALPIFGVVGTITAAGTLVGTVVGAVAGVVDEVSGSK